MISESVVQHKSLLALIGFALATVHAQPPGFARTPSDIYNVKTTYDGSVVFFNTSMRVRGSDQGASPKILKLDPAGDVRLVAERRHSGYDDFSSDFFRLYLDSVSADGSAVLSTAYRVCTAPYSTCSSTNSPSRAVLFPADGRETTVGELAALSRNGRWLAHAFRSSYPGITDLSSGSEAPQLRTQQAFHLYSITSDGSAVLLSVPHANEDLHLISRKGEDRVIASGPYAGVSMDREGRTVAYATSTPSEVFIVDVGTGARWQIGPNDRDSTDPELSDDGSTVIYLSRVGKTYQVMYSNRDGSKWKQLSANPDGVTDATVSGDGRVAFAATATGRLLRIIIEDGTTDVLLRETPSIISGSNSTTGGSTVEVRGLRLRTNDAYATVNGERCPILWSSNDRLSFQVPWETPLTERAEYTTVGLQTADPRLEATAEVRVGTFNPAFIIAVHEDFGFPITAERPAKAGETIHLYMTGLGPVDPPVPTGDPAPLTPLSRVATSFDATFACEYTGTPALISFAGLAPLLVGYYQIDTRIPIGMPCNPLTFVISGPGSDYYSGRAQLYVPVQ